MTNNEKLAEVMKLILQDMIDHADEIVSRNDILTGLEIHIGPIDLWSEDWEMPQIKINSRSYPGYDTGMKIIDLITLDRAKKERNGCGALGQNWTTEE